MKLYWCPRTRSVRILWLLEETGLPYERVQVDIADPIWKSNSDFMAVSPLGKVPGFEDGGTRLWDSGAICAYVADQYPETELAPPIGDPDRGAYLQWLMYTNSVIEPSMAEKFAKLEPRPSQYGWGSWDLMLTTFKAGLARGPWILGDRFSAADILMGTSARYMRQFGMLQHDDVLFAYADRCAERPAFRRALELEAQAVR